MSICSSGHDQPDFAKFCGICGSPVAVPEVATEDLEELEPQIPVQAVPIDLDLMLDDDEDDTDEDEDDTDEDEDDTDEDEDDTDEDEDDTDEDDTDDDTDEDDNANGPSFGQRLTSAPNRAAPNMFGTTVSADAMKLLHDWAEETGELEDPYVKGLTNAVSRRDDLSMWASLDPLEMLPLSVPSSGKRINQASTIVGALRNILVFVPVLLTWLAIGKAINAFGTFTKEYGDRGFAASETPLSFIEFWQNPSDYKGGWWNTQFPDKELLGHFWRIGSVASLDAIIILLIILLTIATGVLTWFADNRESIALESAGRKRVEVGLAIASTLHGKRQATPESISEALAEALNDLTQAARDVNETAARLERVSVGVDSLNPRIEILNSHTEQLVAQTATSVAKAVSDLVSSVQNLNTSVGGNVTTLFSEAANTLEEVSKQFERTSNSAEYGIKQLRDDLEAMHIQLQSIINGGRS